MMMIALWGICGLVAWAQPANYRPLMDQAKKYFDQKEYTKAIECYEKVVEEIKGTDYESLTPTIRTSIAINNLYLGIAALEEKDYASAKPYLENAIMDAKPESKTYYMAHSWMGRWNSLQALSIRTNRSDYKQAVQFSLEAERHFDLAKAPEKRLNEQLSRASALQNLLQNDEAETLLKQVINECKDFSNRNIILGKATFMLGGIEMETERFQLAIQHLEQGYELCIVSSTVEAKSYAYLCAYKLSSLFSNQIPDDEKAVLWKQRADGLESQITQ